MASVLMPRQPKDQLTAISQALGIANSVYGLATKTSQFDALSQQQELKEQAADPNSEVSAQTRQRAIDLGLKVDDSMSAVAIKNNFGDLSGIAKEQRGRDFTQQQQQQKQQFQGQQQQQKLASAEKLTQQKQLATSNKETKAKLKEVEELQTPLGTARTKEDAKELKTAFEMKEKLDRQLGEMITLRKEFGGEVLDREAVARGKQLSKDLLLTYKNLAKLGVLSQSDESIINAIIPSDPLEFSVSSLAGQDPIMTSLEKFRGDVNADFETKLKTRLKDNPSQGQSLANNQIQEKIQKEVQALEGIDPSNLIQELERRKRTGSVR